MEHLKHIERLYEHLLLHLTKENKVQEASAKLLKLKNNEDKVEMVYDLLKEYKYLPPVMKVDKDAGRSNDFRNAGNIFFKAKQDGKALKKYNEAIIHAPKLSKELSLGFANRSAVLFSLEKYQECLNDIENAINAGYDEQLKPKLLKRKLLCEEALSKEDTEEEEELQATLDSKFKISKPPNPKIPCAIGSLEITYSKEFGRSVIATEDIKVGEVLAVESPYCSVLLEPNFMKQCCQCMQISDSLLPCDTCCYVMFCSQACKEKAWEDFHEVECPLMPYLVNMKFVKLELLALRTVVFTKTSISDWNEIASIVNEVESETEPLLKGFKNEITDGATVSVFDSKYYNSIHALETNVSQRSVSDIFQKAVTAAVFLHLLSSYTPFFEKTDDAIVAKKLAGGLLLHHTMTAPSNMHSLNALVNEPSGVYVNSEDYGGAAFAFLSLINHSCAPNVVRHNRGLRNALVALRPIKKGGQLLDNYGYHHALHKISDRQKSLLFQYYFRCACEACVNHWPMYFELPRANITGKIPKQYSKVLLTMHVIEELQNKDVKFALRIIQELHKYAMFYEKYSPCVEIAQHQEAIKQCWSLFGNIVTNYY